MTIPKGAKPSWMVLSRLRGKCAVAIVLQVTFSHQPLSTPCGMGNGMESKSFPLSYAVLTEVAATGHFSFCKSG